MIKRQRRRAGLTLLEVVVAMAIFFISLIVILQLTSLGSDRATDVRLIARSSMLCQSKMSEVVIGATPMSSSGYAEYPNEKDMQWKMEAEQVEGVAGLWNVHVSVRAELPTGRVVESQLTQMVVDPSMRGSTMDVLNMQSTTPGNNGS